MGCGGGAGRKKIRSANHVFCHMKKILKVDKKFFMIKVTLKHSSLSVTNKITNKIASNKCIFSQISATVLTLYF